MTQQQSVSSAIKARVLAESLPYIRRFSGSIIVIKYGGNAMTESALKEGFARDVVLLKLIGLHPVIVHGGGPQINEMLEKVGKKGEFVQGMRVTDSETMDIVDGFVPHPAKRECFPRLPPSGGRAVGITGRDNHFIKAEKLLIDTPEQKGVDIGQVGTVADIDTRLVEGLVERGCIPVIAPIGVGQNGEAFNINADLVAGKLAEKLQAEKLLMMTNIPGVLDKEGKLLTTLTPSRIDELIEDGTLYGGMLPKIASAVEAAKSGVKATHIIDGRVPNALLLEVLTDDGVGSMILGEG